MTSGSHWSEAFIEQISDKEIRNELVRDQVRTRLALLIRALRDQDERKWSQTELGKRMGKPQSVVSRIEDPDYGKLSLQTLFEVAEAFDLPLWIDLPEWEDWFGRIKEVRMDQLHRTSFCASKLIERSKPAGLTADDSNSNVVWLDDRRTPTSGIPRRERSERSDFYGELSVL